MKNKYLLTILLIIGIIFFIPKNVEAANPVPAFRCFYKLDVTEGSDKKTYTLKLIYVNGELKAVKYEDSTSDYNIQNSTWEMKDYKSKFSYLGMDKLNNVGTSCPESVTATNGYLIQRNLSPGIQEEKNKKFIYKLTSKGTQSLGTVSDKDCSYTNSKKEPSTVNIHFYRTKYSSSYDKSNQNKIVAFWQDKYLLYAGDVSGGGKTKVRKYYESLYDYITDYSSKPTTCPPKIFYNPNNKKTVVAYGKVSDQQPQDGKFVDGPNFPGADKDYIVYKLDKNKICREQKDSNNAKLSSLENRTTALENKISAAGSNPSKEQITYIVNTTTQIFTDLEKFDDAISGCEDAPGYDDLKNRGKTLTDKLNELKKLMKDAIRNSTALSDDEKSNLLKDVDKAYAKMKKLSSLDPDIYNKEQSCGTIFGDPADVNSVAYIIQRILNYIKIIGPILVIILSSIDFIKAIWSSDDENMKKAQQKLAKRLVAAVLLFLLPSLVGLIISLINSNITDPTCGIQ